MRSRANQLSLVDTAGRSSRFLEKAVSAGVLLWITLLLASCGTANRVVIYCAQDQVYAEPIFENFQKETGIKVFPVFDNEAVKTVGIANRLLAERSHPQCDVYWGNEEMRARQLAAEQVFRDTDGWKAFGYRSRRIVINTNQLSVSAAPHSLNDLTNDSWHGKVALAFPQFGTTATQFHVLRQIWGDARWESWCTALAANKPLLVEGNSVVVKVVGRGDASVGLTDSDDIAAGQAEGLPLAALPMTEETLLLPNAVGVIRDAPHAAAAQKLFEYLQRQDVVARLLSAKAIEGASENEVSRKALVQDWGAVLRDIKLVTDQLNKIFLR